ncbi:murein hydrolase activator EnvC family protein [Halalkalibacter urbisdiaboli]|uniref:murein hydrolase activator EnvC family protein n=1 Tax=Halalkalibacter urbisdiaboli TaxID=1960589 RepID=UPI000B43FB3A|nr:M23 family metallopeptidase [Halalkalibacter urbisdiaboli]
MRRRRIGVVLVAVLVAVSSFGWRPLDHLAQANSEIKSQISDVKSEREEKQEQARKTEEEIEKLEREKEQLNNEIREIDHAVATTNQKIREKQTEIESVREDIEALKAKIVVLEERIVERDGLLKERARSMYQTGGTINYLEVILGAKSFGDFLDRVSALSVIAQQDRNILEAHIEDQRQLEEAKEAVEAELKKLENHLIDLENLMAELEQQRNQKDKLMTRLEQKEGELHEELGELENADEILRQQEAALKKELAAYEERKRREAEENRRSQEAASRSGQVHSTPVVTEAGFMRPATGSITSTYGPRATFGGRMHHGIDIGKNGRSGDVPIVAVQDGTVVSSYYSNSYGNTVLIAHYVDGQLITTLYAHLENREVSAGDSVSKGQRIGMMGNTGRSFGAHLHFEVHEGGWNGSKSNAVDPLNYIPR